MERKEFLFKTRAVCGCAGMALLSGRPVRAAVTDDKEDWRVGFMQKRFAHLVDFMNTNVDEATQLKMFEEMGRFCAGQHKEGYEKFTANTEAFLKDLEGQFIEKTTFDKEKQTISLLGKKQDSCVCAFAGGKNISPDFCNCSRGYMKEMFTVITGKPVEVTLDESILRGSDRCSFTIHLNG
jgi:predicted hydrocarbon binding protein